MKTSRLSLLIAAIVVASLAAFTLSSVEAGNVIMAGAANPCAANPCSMQNPCAANPCAANPCAMKANPCSMKNPCAANPCASASTIPLRSKAITGKKELNRMARRLWKDTSLGTAGLSCASCHPKGQGLKKKPFPKYVKMPNDVVTMDQMINYCILNPMKAKAPLAWNSQEMTALAAYVAVMSKRGVGKMKNPCGLRKKNPRNKR